VEIHRDFLREKGLGPIRGKLFRDRRQGDADPSSLIKRWFSVYEIVSPQAGCKFIKIGTCGYLHSTQRLPSA